MDAMRAQFMLMLDMLRDGPESADAWTPTIGGSTRRPIRWRPVKSADVGAQARR